MAGTLTQTQLQLQNAESSLLFMQQEHAKTLQGLYAEINKLQKKCGEMNFKLAMNTTSSSTSEEQTRNEYDETVKELRDLRVEHLELKAVIGTKDTRIVFLEGELSKVKKVFEDELSSRDKEISELTVELNAKSDTVAYLTNQLHQSKLKQAGRKRDDEERRKQEVTNSSGGNVSKPHIPTEHVENVSIRTVPQTPNITPVPPKDGVPSGVRRRPYKRASTSPSPHDVSVISVAKSTSTCAVGVQASSSEMQLSVSPARSSKGMMPARNKQDSSQYRPGHGRAKGSQRLSGHDRLPPEDYVEFLKTGARQEPQVVVRAAPDPLPPIASHEQISAAPYTGRVQVSRGHPVTDDVGTIIVSPLSSPEKGWRHKQQSHQPNGGLD